MRFIRLLGAVVIFYGLSYLLHALGQGVYVVRGGDRQALIFFGINLIIGIVTIGNGLGLLLAQKWARIAWLITVTVLVVFHGLVLLLTHLAGQDLTQQMLNVILTFFLAAISWAKLPDSATKKHFS